MSADRADTLAAMAGEMLGTWMARNGGGFVAAFTLAVEYVDEDGDRSWAVAHADGQTGVQTMGLLAFHQVHAELSAREALEG